MSESIHRKKLPPNAQARLVETAERLKREERARGRDVLRQKLAERAGRDEVLRAAQRAWREPGTHCAVQRQLVSKTVSAVETTRRLSGERSPSPPRLAHPSVVVPAMALPPSSRGVTLRFDAAVRDGLAGPSRRDSPDALRPRSRESPGLQQQQQPPPSRESPDLVQGSSRSRESSERSPDAQFYSAENSPDVQPR